MPYVPLPLVKEKGGEERLAKLKQKPSHKF